MIDRRAKLEILELPIDKLIVPSFDSFRFDRLQEYFESLTSRPDANLHPILVVPLPSGKYKVYDGRHRFMATYMAKRETILAVVISNQKEL